eukprot:3205548-Rhodomonas_salina.2
MDTGVFVNEVEEWWLCAICSGVMLHPVCCKAGHAFCSECINEWLEKSKSCPSRCGPLYATDLAFMRTVDIHIQNQQVRCGNVDRPVSVASASPLAPATAAHTPSEALLTPSEPSLTQEGVRHTGKRSRLGRSEDLLLAGASNASPPVQCGWVGKLSDRDRHLHRDCPFVWLQCKFEGCKASFTRSQQAAHEVDCEYRDIVCESCQELVNASKLKQHLRDDCATQIDVCPHGCGEFILRAQMSEHLNQCGKVLVSCDYQCLGCTAICRREDIDKHMSEAMSLHTHMVLTTVPQMKAELEQACAKGGIANGVDEKRLSSGEKLRLPVRAAPSPLCCAAHASLMSRFGHRMR